MRTIDQAHKEISDLLKNRKRVTASDLLMHAIMIAVDVRATDKGSSDAATHSVQAARQLLLMGSEKDNVETMVDRLEEFMKNPPAPTPVPTPAPVAAEAPAVARQAGQPVSKPDPHARPTIHEALKVVKRFTLCQAHSWFKETLKDSKLSETEALETVTLVAHHTDQSETIKCSPEQAAEEKEALGVVLYMTQGLGGTESPAEILGAINDMMTQQAPAATRETKVYQAEAEDAAPASAAPKAGTPVWCLQHPTRMGGVAGYRNTFVRAATAEEALAIFDEAAKKRPAGDQWERPNWCDQVKAIND